MSLVRPASALLIVLFAACSIPAGEVPAVVRLDTVRLEDGGQGPTSVQAGFFDTLDCERVPAGECVFVDCPGDAGFLPTRPFVGVLRVGAPNDDGGVPTAFSHSVFAETPPIAPESAVLIGFTPSPGEPGAVPAFEASLQMPSSGTFSVPSTTSRAQDLSLSLPSLSHGQSELRLAAMGVRQSIACTFSSTVGIVPASLLSRLPAGQTFAFGNTVISRSVVPGVVLEGRTYQATSGPTPNMTTLSP